MYKKTRQKKAIMDVLKATSSHPTAEWVYDQVKKEIPNISLGTVYRNLKMMNDTGEIKERYFRDGIGRFDARIDNHYHFICELCGKISDINEPGNNNLNSVISEKTGLYINSHSIEFTGLCTECMNTGEM